MGADMELQEFDMEFIKGYNFFGDFNVPEDHKEGEQFVTRDRKLLWRHHPVIFWENLVDEEAVYSAYRETGFGIVFGNAEWKRLPIVGKIVHYGYQEDGGEWGETFRRKKAYYQVLRRFQRIINKCNWRLLEPEEQLENVLIRVYNNPNILKEMDTNEAVQNLVDRIRTGDYPIGLSEFGPILTELIDHE
jgi:hypothetical protein